MKSPDLRCVPFNAGAAPACGRHLSNQRGMAFVSVLVVLIILGALYLGYFGVPAFQGKRSAGTAAIDASRAVACRTQRQGVEREINMWKVNHPDEEPSMSALRSSGVRIPACPEGGTIDVHGSSVVCSLHR